MKRRLTAILAADVVGYSRLMGVDEMGTLTAINTLREELISPCVSEHNGQVVKLMGDGILVDFASVVDAVQCALEIQNGVALRNEKAASDRHILFRIGINVGDVIVEDQDIFGDGVNIAARLESMAEPGEIYLSGDAYRQVKNKLDADFEDLGEKQMKNIAEPVRTYRVQRDTTGQASAPAATEKASRPSVASIAVLPFSNLSADPEQGYFSDGITDDLITALSNVRSFFVIDRSSSFTFKDQRTDVTEVGRKLGVRYVLGGSVRKSGNRVRVSAQLVDASTGSHVWADRYDGALDDIFDLQDKIAASVVGALEPQLLRAEVQRIRHKRPENFDAYDLTLYGLARMNELTSEASQQALSHFLEAIEADPNYARAYCCASWCYRRQVQLKGMILSDEDKEESIRLAQASLQADQTDPYVLWQAGVTFGLIANDFDTATTLIDRSLAANSNANRAWLASSMMRCFAGDPDKAIEHAERAIQLSPLDTSMWVAYGNLASAHMQLGHYEEAVNWARKSVGLYADNLLVRVILASALAQNDLTEEADVAVGELTDLEPGLTIDRFQQRFPVGKYRNLDGFLEGLKKANLPLA